MGDLAAAVRHKLSGRSASNVSALGARLVFDPNFVLMDEPLGALDKQLREPCSLKSRIWRMNWALRGFT